MASEPTTSLVTIAWWAYQRPRAAWFYLNQRYPQDLSFVAPSEDTPTPLVWLADYPRQPQYGWWGSQDVSSFILEGRDTLARRLTWKEFPRQPQLGWLATSDVPVTPTFGGEAPYPIYFRPIHWPGWVRQPWLGWSITHDQSGPPTLPIGSFWSPPVTTWISWRRQPWGRTTLAPLTSKIQPPGDGGNAIPPIKPPPQFGVVTTLGTGTLIASGSAAVSTGATTATIPGSYPTGYRVVISTNWLTTWDVVSRTPTAFTVAFGVPAPALSASMDWMVWT